MTSMTKRDHLILKCAWCDTPVKEVSLPTPEERKRLHQAKTKKPFSEQDFFLCEECEVISDNLYEKYKTLLENND